jgi:FkbM family methyltransferase
MEVPTGDYVGRRLYMGNYERPETAILRRLLRRGATCVDVGANLGYYSLLFASRAGSMGRVLAIEPNPMILPFLIHNIRGSGIELVEAAIDPLRSYSEMSVVGRNLGASTLREVPDGSKTVEVTCSRLDDVLRSRAIHHVDLLKIDTEGWEGPVLESLGNYLSGERVRAILLEASPEFGDLGYVNDLLSNPGYKVFGISPHTHRFKLTSSATVFRVRSGADIEQQTTLLVLNSEAESDLWR